MKMADEHNTSPMHNSDSEIFWLSKFQVAQCKTRMWRRMCRNHCHLLTFEFRLLQQNLHFLHCTACMQYKLS